MCLHRLKKDIKIRKEKGFNVGFKRFRKDSKGNLYSCFRGKRKRYQVGKWLNQKDFREHPEMDYIGCDSASDFYYKTGFHIYTGKSFVGFRKVYFRKVVARGLEVNDEIIVAEEMYIVPFKDLTKEERKLYK